MDISAGATIQLFINLFWEDIDHTGSTKKKEKDKKKYAAILEIFIPAVPSSQKYIYIILILCAAAGSITRHTLKG